MAGASSHFKLGLFALGGIAGIFAAVFALGLRGSRSPTVAFHTYFDESVQGLELGAPVAYRGVKIGSVAAIEVAPDHRHIDVSLALVEREVRRLGLATPAPELRTQLASQGITGLKLVDLDFVAPGTEPPPALGFVPAAHSLPSRTSLFKRLEDRSGELGHGIVELANVATGSLRRFDALLDDIHDQRLAARVAVVVDRSGDAIAELRRLVAHVDRAGVPAKAAAALDGVAEVASGVRRITDRIDGDGGLVATARGSIEALGKALDEALGELGRNARGSTDELERTIRDLGDAARAVRELVDEIDRDPDMLVKGRGTARGR